MRALLLFLISLPAFATWANVQTQVGSLCFTSTTCAVTVTSTGTGHLLTVHYATTDSTFISSVSGGGTWVHPAGCQVTTAGSGSTDQAYVLISTSGTTTVTVTATGASGVAQVQFAESSYTAGSVAFGVCGVVDQASSTPVAGVALSLVGPSGQAIIFQTIKPSQNATAVTTYTGRFDNGIGYAYLLNTSSGTAPSWTVVGAALAGVSGMQLYEVTARRRSMIIDGGG